MSFRALEFVVVASLLGQAAMLAQAPNGDGGAPNARRERTLSFSGALEFVWSS